MSPSFKRLKSPSFWKAASVGALAFMATAFAPAASADVNIGELPRPGAILQGGLSAVLPRPESMLDKYLKPGMLNITGLGLMIETPTRIRIVANTSLENPFGMPMPLGNVGLNIHLDDQSLANLTAFNLTIGPGISPFNATGVLDLADGKLNPALKVSITNLVTLLSGTATPLGPPPRLVVSNITFNGNPLGMAPVEIPTQFPPSAPIAPPPAPAPGAIGIVAPPPPPPPVVGLSGLVNPAINFTMPTLNKVTFIAQSGATLKLGVGFEWNNPFNIELEVPSISVDIGLNFTRLATIRLEQLSLKPGNMMGDVSAYLSFNNDPVAAVQTAALLNDFMAGTLTQTLNIGNITFGALNSTNMTDFNDLLSGIQINLSMQGLSTVALKEFAMSYISQYLPIDISQIGGSASSALSYLKGLALKTSPGHTLLIEPKIQVPLAFGLDINIPYFAMDISLGDSRLAKVFIANMLGTGSGLVDISLGIGLIFDEPNPSMPPTVASVVSGLLSGSPVDVHAGFGNLAIGVSPQDAVNTLNNIYIGSSISSVIKGGVSTGDLLGDVLSKTSVTVGQNAIAINVGTLASLTIHEANIAILPNNYISAAINLDMFLGLPIVADIGYFGINVALDGSQLAGIALNSRFAYNGGTAAMIAGLDISVGTGDEIATKVATLVNAVIAKQSVSSSIGINGLVLGDSPSDTITALSQISVSFPLGGLLNSNDPSASGNFMSSLIAQLGLKLSGLSLATIPNAGLRVGATAAFSNPIPVTVSVPYIGVSGGLDDVDITNVGVNNLALVTGGNNLEASIDLNFNNADSAQNKVATFVGRIAQGQLGQTPEALTIHNLRLGASPTDYFDLLSKISISVPSSSVINRPNVDYISGLLGLNLAQVGGDMLKNVQISQLSADLSQPPVIALGTSVVVSGINLQASVDIGYFGIDLALDSTDVAHIDVPQITIHTANNQLALTIQASVAVRDTPQLADVVGKLANYLLTADNTVPVNSLVISKPLLGETAQDTIQTFSLISYPVGLPPLLAQAKTYVGGILNGGNSTDFLNRIGLSNIVIDLNAPQVIGIDAGVLIKGLTLPAQIKLNYVGVDIGIDATNLAQVSVPKLDIGSNGADLTIGTHVDATVATSDAAQSAVAGLVNAVLAKQVPQGNIVINNLAIGGSQQNTFKFLQRIQFAIPLSKIFAQLPAPTNPNPTDLINRIGLSNLIIDLNAPQVIGIDVGILIKSLSIPAQIKLNYVGVDLGVDATNLAQISVPKLELGSNGADLTIGTRIDATVATSEAAQGVVAGLVDAAIAGQVPQGNLVITNLAVGASKDNTFKIFQGIKFGLPLSQLFGLIPANGTAPNPTDLLSRIGLSDLVLDFNAPQVLGIDAGVVIKSLSIPAQIKLNYVGLDIGVDAVNLAQISVPKLQLGSNGADLTIATRVDATVASSEAAQGVVAGLFNAILAGQVPAGNIVVTNFAVGASKDSTFKIFQAIKLGVPLSKIFGLLPANTTTPNPTDLLSRIGLSNLVVDLNSPQVVGIDVGILVKSLSIPAQIKLNYVGVDIGVEGVNLAQVAVPKLQLGSNGADLTIATSIAASVATSDAAQTVVAGLVNAMMAGQVPQGNIIVSNLAVGANKDNTFKIFQGIKLSVPLAKLIGSAPGGGAGNSTSILDRVILDSANINMRNPPKIGADLALAVQGLSFDAKILLNYVSVSAALDSTPLATINVPSIELASGNNQVALKVQTLIGLEESGEIQDKVAALVNAIIGGTAAPGANLVIGNIAFGGSAGNVFTILDKVRVSVPLAPYIKMIQDMIGGTGAAPGGAPAFSITQLDLSAPGANELAAAVGASLGGVASKISVDMPYIGLSVNANGANLISPAVNNLQLSNGKVSLSASLPFGAAAPQIIGSLSGPVSQLMFSSVGNVPGSIVASGIKFGASPSQAYNIAGKVAVTVELNSVFQKAQAYINANNPLRVQDMDTVLTPTGIQASIKVPGVAIGVPVKLNFGGDGIQLSAFHQGSGAIMGIKAGSVQLTSTPWVLGAYITPLQPNINKAMESILPNALKWKNALEGVTLGGIQLGSFTTLSQLSITPPEVTLWSPMKMQNMKLKLIPLGMDFEVNFVNGGPLQVDMGFVDVLVKSNGKNAIQVTTSGPAVHLNNANQNGGVNDLKLYAGVKVSFWDVIPVLAGLLNPSNAISCVFNMRSSSGAPLTWLNQILDSTPSSVFNEMLPILVEAMKNIKWF
ncbi:hypothetical protein DFQ26_003493 [Actinomortierella ambigua]|nr:hypothetical protein DFQ26_003493 [Actinomortierella ambigua]